VKGSVFFSGAIGVIAAAAPSLADNLTIDKGMSSPVATTAAANGTAGNIDITTSGSVAINAAGAAVTLNSNNTVSNSGTISNSVGTGAIGVNITAGNTGSFTNIGTINVPGTGTPPTSTGQFGILLNGSGAFTGDIITKSGSTLTIAGSIANAIAIQSELNGNLTLGGSITATGSGTSGILTSAPIDGLLSNTGTIKTLSAGTSTTALNPVPGSAVAIGSSVLGGILNVGPVNSADKTAPATISTVGSAPAFIVAPSFGADAADIVIGVLSDSNAPGNSIINRGVISASGEQPGVTANAIQIGNASDNTSGRMTLLSGGIYNSGSFTATATSNSIDAVTLPPVATNATAIILGVGAVVPRITNDTAGTISAVTGGVQGGNAVALSIQTGASLTSLVNAGMISASANTTDTSIAALTAYAIQDTTGTLTNITNSGAISAAATALDSGAQSAIAADLSAANSAITFNNSGTVKGDLLFGAATSNQLSIDGAKAIVSGRIQTTRGGIVNVAVSNSGMGGTLQTDRVINAGTLTVGPGGTVDFQIGASSTVISTSGAAAFDAASHIVITPVALLPTASSIQLIHSDTSLGFGNFVATTATANIPFLFTGSLSAGAQDLTLTLQRKTASQLGLTGNAAAIYEPAAAAALEDSQFGAVFGSLSSNAAAQATLEQLLPLRSSAAGLIVDTLTNPAADTIGLRQRRLTLDSGADAGFSPWAQGFYNLLNGSGENGFTGRGQGEVIGVDFNQGGKGHVGAALTIYEGTVQEKNPRTASTDAHWYLFTPYLGFRADDFFLNAQFNAGSSEVTGSRTVVAGSLMRVADSHAVEMLAAGGITGGYSLNLGFLQLIPQVSISETDLVDNAYTENGGGAGVDLAVGARSKDSTRAFVGIEAGGAYETNEARLVPQLLAGWGRGLTASSGNINAAFASIPTSTFVISGPTSDRSQLVASARLDYVMRNWSVGLNYSALASSNAVSQSAGIALSSRF
jgi:hypothetical protein